MSESNRRKSCDESWAVSRSRQTLQLLGETTLAAGMLKCLWLIRSQCSPNGKRYENLRTRHEIQNAILFWTHLVKCIPFVLWALQFLTICRACRHYLFFSSSQTFEMCYLDKICLLFGYVYYLVIFHNEDIRVRSSGPVSPTKAPVGANSSPAELSSCQGLMQNPWQIRCEKKTRGPTFFFLGWGGGGGWGRIYAESQGWRIKHINWIICIKSILTFSRTLPYLQKSFQKVHPNIKVKPLAAWEVQPGWVRWQNSSGWTTKHLEMGDF